MASLTVTSRAPHPQHGAPLTRYASLADPLVDVPNYLNGIARQTRVFAFLPRWPERGLKEVEKYLDLIDVVIPELFQIDTAKGDIRSSDLVWQATISNALDAKVHVVSVIPLVKGDANDAAALASGRLRQTLAENLASVVKSGSYDGFCMDFPATTAADQSNVLKFLIELKAIFRARGSSTCMVIPINADPKWMGGLTKVADFVILRSSNEEAYASSPMPLAEHQWFRNSLEQARLHIDADKTVVALGNYGLDWVAGNAAPAVIGYPEVARLSGRHGKRIHLDTAALNSRFEYTDAQGRQHLIWLLDAVSAYNQMLELRRAGINNIALEGPATADPGVWELLRNEGVTNGDPSSAEIIDLGSYVGEEGAGDLLQVTSVPTIGRRIFTRDGSTGLITDQFYVTLPNAYTVTRRGSGNGRMLALTFDDGPDVKSTAQILDILRQERVPAAFFLSGANALDEPDLVKRQVDEGHEVGNHFFYHSSLPGLDISKRNFEVNATQRLIATLTGRHTALLRPPYGIDDIPGLEIDGTLPALSELSRQGYVIAGNTIDPHDWKSITASEIAERVSQAVLAGEGNVILLHDAGGDRSETIKALPIVLRSLQAKGYSFVSLSQLLGLTRDDLMPPARGGEWIDYSVFLIAIWIDDFVVGIFLFAIALLIGRALLLCGLSVMRRRHEVVSAGDLPPVTVLIPAFNEESVILKTLSSVLQTDYRNFNVIVIDDGSTDQTFDRVQQAHGHDSNIKIIQLPNRGKAAALNYGFSASESEIVVALDADTILLPDAIRHLAGHFADARVAAVAGNAKVGNRSNLLTKMQALEYIVAQNLDRRAFDFLNTIAVVPGSIGAWRRSAVMDAGGYPQQTLAEDADLTITLLRRGHRIVYEERAIALTEAPECIGQFMKQRFRWTFGMLQVAWRHRGAIFEKRPVGWVALPNIVLFQFLLPVLAPVVDLVLLYTLGRLSLHMFDTGGFDIPPEFQRYLLLYGAFLAVDLLLALFVFATGEPTENKRLIWFVLFQRFFYNQILYATTIRAAWTALAGGMVGWLKLHRLATVELPGVRPGIQPPSNLVTNQFPRSGTDNDGDRAIIAQIINVPRHALIMSPIRSAAGPAVVHSMPVELLHQEEVHVSRF